MEIQTGYKPEANQSNLTEMGRRGAEVFDQIYLESNLVDYVLDKRSLSGGKVLLMLGAVGGGGAGKKVSETIQEFTSRNVQFDVMAMSNYLQNNPLIVFPESAPVYEVDDSTESWEKLTSTCFDTLSSIPNKPSTVVSFGPRTPNVEAARRYGVENIFIIDGAVPDSWNTSVGKSGFPDTPYYLPAYQASTYITTCGWAGGWQPPGNTVPPGVETVVKSQPFSKEFVNKLSLLRDISPNTAREVLLKSGKYPELAKESLLVVPTMDKIYIDPTALLANGGWLTTEQYGQSCAFITEAIVGLSRTRIPTLIYLPNRMRDMVLPVVDMFASENLKVFSRDVIPNEDYLLLRKAGVSIGRAPLCVSTAEELAMGNPFVLCPVPGRTSDGTSYMTEAEAFKSFKFIGAARCMELGDSVSDAIIDVANIKKLL